VSASGPDDVAVGGRCECRQLVVAKEDVVLSVAVRDVQAHRRLTISTVGRYVEGRTDSAVRTHAAEVLMT